MAGKTKDPLVESTKRGTPPLWAIIMMIIIILSSIPIIYSLVKTKTPPSAQENIVIVEDRGVLADFNNDGYTDYIQYIYAEVVYGGENTNFQTGTGQ